MKIILDTNVLLSALIKNSFTRKLIIDSDWEFYYPEESQFEIRKYKQLVKEKAEITDQEYKKLIKFIFDFVIILPNYKIMSHLKEAKRIMLKIDPDDVIFIAAALSIPNSVIWSDDKDFDKQNEVKVLKSTVIGKL